MQLKGTECRKIKIKISDIPKFCFHPFTLLLRASVAGDGKELSVDWHDKFVYLGEAVLELWLNVRRTDFYKETQT